MPFPAGPALSAEAEALEAQITELAAHIHAASYRLLTLIAELDRREIWADHGCRSCAHWLNWKCGIDLGAGREKARVAKALPSLPRISAAFGEGRVSYSKVRAMPRVTTPENEFNLLNIALYGTAARVEKLVRAYRRAREAEALDLVNLRHAKPALTWYHDEDGSVVFHCRLEPEDGGRVIKAPRRAFKAVNLASETSERFFAAELHRLSEVFLLLMGESNQSEAEQCFLKALKDARRQQAKSLELHAAVSLRRLWRQQGKVEPAREMLGEIYAWFRQGFDTADLEAAKQLLEELRLKQAVGSVDNAH